MKLDGLLLVDKPAGMTSHDVVYRMRRILNLKEIGHSGTLDPQATGLMVLLLGEATKLSEFITQGDKAYELTATFGYNTDAWDADGPVTETFDKRATEDEIRSAANELLGDLELEVPRFSAIKIQGKKLYEYARAGAEVEVPKRPMTFSNLEILEVTPEKLKARVACSKGGYIRSWSYQLGRRLGTGATLTGLRRLRSEPYHVDFAVTLEQLEEAAKQENLGSSFIPLAEALPNLKAFHLEGRDERLMTQGQIPFRLSRLMTFDIKESQREQKTRRFRVLSRSSGHLLSLLEIQPEGRLKIRRIFKGVTAEAIKDSPLPQNLAKSPSIG